MLSEPHWLLLLFPLIWLIFKFKPDSNKILILRLLLLFTLCMALAEPIVKIAGREGVVILVADRSASMPKASDRRIQETISILRQKMPANSRLGLVSFGDKARIEFSPTKNSDSALSIKSDSNGSNLAAALQLATSLIPDEMSGRIIILSDGLWNGENPVSAAITAANRGIPIDYRHISRRLINDLAISYFKVPPVLEPKRPFLIKAGLFSPLSQKIDVELVCNGNSLVKAARDLSFGLNEITFSLYAPESSVLNFYIKISVPEGDSVPENNIARAVSMVKGKRPVLVASNSKPSAMLNLLKANKIEAVGCLARDFSWRLEELQGYSAVILENVPSEMLGFGGMSNVAAWVKHMGGGLFMTGGKWAYGNGGYYQSPLEETLPVSLEMKSENRKIRVAIAVVLDRSGSMSMLVKGRTKMELANIAAASSLDLLAPTDEFCLFAVDTKPHVVVPLQDVRNKGNWYEDILRVESGGGGIYVYDGIRAAVDTLKNAKAKTRHIILFSDASDSEKPGNYWELTSEAKSLNMTLSVIGLGRESDKDGNLLKKIAEEGEGRCFFTEKAEDLPRLFSQDTFLALKGCFLEEKQSITSSLAMNSFIGINKPAFSSFIEAYNVCYLKPEASLLVYAENDEASPILSAWQYGLGRVACYTGVIDSQYGGDFLRSQNSSDILCGLCNWLAFDDTNSTGEIVANQKIQDGKWVGNINLDPERIRDPFQGAPMFELLVSDDTRDVKHLSLNPVWENADKISVSYNLRGNEVVNALLKTGRGGGVRLSPACQIYSSEFLPQNNRDGEKELEKLSKMTGGNELIDLNSIWENMPSIYQSKNISHWFFILALFVFLLEVAERRTALISIVAAKIRGLAKNKEAANLGLKETATLDQKKNVIDGETIEEVGKSSINIKPAPKAEVFKEATAMLGALKAAKKKADHRINK